MTMPSGIRKFVLTLHVTFSIGWIGTVIAFLTLAIAGLTQLDAQMIRGFYLAMELIARFVIVPLCFASVLSGLALSLGSKWGLFKHYWILIKFLITIIATIGLLVHMQPISYLAAVAAETTLSSADLSAQIQIVVAAGAAIVGLLIATSLGIYKPRGLTRYGWRKQQEKRKMQ